MTDTIALSGLPSGQAIKPASGALTLDGTVIGSTNKQAGTFTAVSADTVTSPLGSFTVVSATTPITGSSGGTGNAFMTFSGPATPLKTYTLPNATTTILTTNSAVTVAQGGTGVQTLASNSVLVGNGTGNVGGIAPGNNGNVLTSNGTTWASTAAGAATTQVVLLSTLTASASSTLSFTSLITSAYDLYYVIFKDLVTSTTASVNMVGSSNNGSTYAISFSTQKQQIQIGSSSAPTYTGVSNSTPVLISTSTSGTTYSGYMWLVNPLSTVNSAGFESRLSCSFGNYDATYGLITSSAAINAIQFAPSAGNFTSGKIYLYGVKNT